MIYRIKAALRSRSANTAMFPASAAMIITDITLMSAVSVEYVRWYADCTSGSVPIFPKCIYYVLNTFTFTEMNELTYLLLHKYRDKYLCFLQAIYLSTGKWVSLGYFKRWQPTFQEGKRICVVNSQFWKAKMYDHEGSGNPNIMAPSDQYI